MCSSSSSSSSNNNAAAMQQQVYTSTYGLDCKASQTRYCRRMPVRDTLRLHACARLQRLLLSLWWSVWRPPQESRYAPKYYLLCSVLLCVGRSNRLRVHECSQRRSHFDQKCLPKSPKSDVCVPGIIPRTIGTRICFSSLLIVQQRHCFCLSTFVCQVQLTADVLLHA